MCIRDSVARKQLQVVKLKERPSRSAQTTFAERGTGPTHSTAAARASGRVGTADTRGRGTGPSHSSIETGCERWVSVPRGRYRHRARKGIQAPRAQAAAGCETECASRVVGTDDTRERGYRPHALKQEQDVKLNESPARSVQTTPAEGGTDPTKSSSSSMCN